MSCKKANDIDKEPLSAVALSIIPDFSDGSVYSYSDDGSFFLRVGVTPEEYLDKFGNDGKYIYRADFRKVITKAPPEEPDFSVIGEISSTSVEEGCLTASFMLTEDEMEKMWDADYVVSFAVKAKDGSDGFMTAFVPVSWYSRDGSGGDKEIFEVGGHKVTMKIADGIDSKDILTRSFVDAQCERTITNGKQVFFSKGNLWCSTDSHPQASDFHFETNQYDTTPSSDDDRVRDHISHFMWCRTAEQAIALQYDSSWKREEPFFAEKNFTVNGVNTWRTLTGGDKGEWKYLINKDNECGQTIRSGKYMYGVKVCGSANCLILLPDDWKWGENGVGSGWLSEYNESTTVKWSTMENAGAVCLPAAGSRDGYNGGTLVYFVGSTGDYWSSTPNNDPTAYSLSFTSGNVDPAYFLSRYYAYAVRLVTESK